MSTKMLFLSEEDTIKCGILDPKFCIDNAAEVFQLLESGDFLFGGPSHVEHGHQLFFPKTAPHPGFPVAASGYSFMAMLGYVGGRFHAIGEKWYGRNPKNIEKGIPRANHMVMLNDVETGVPKCLITSNLLSAMRSAAAPALAAREMAPKDSKVIGLLGAGLLNRATLPCLLHVCPEVKEVRVYDIRADRSEAFCKEFSERFGINVHPVDSDEAAVRDCDIIHIAASGSNLPYIKREWLNQNALIVFNCSVPCDESVIDESNVSVDLYDAHVAWRNADPHQGLTGYRIIERVEDGRMKREDVMDLGAILAGKCQPKKDRPSMFIFHGMPPLDIALAHDVYTRAVEQEIGREMPLWEKPHWF